MKLATCKPALVFPPVPAAFPVQRVVPARSRLKSVLTNSSRELNGPRFVLLRLPLFHWLKSLSFLSLLLNSSWEDGHIRIRLSAFLWGGFLLFFFYFLSRGFWGKKEYHRGLFFFSLYWTRHSLWLKSGGRWSCVFFILYTYIVLLGYSVLYFLYGPIVLGSQCPLPWSGYVESIR